MALGTHIDPIAKALGENRVVLRPQDPTLPNRVKEEVAFNYSSVAELLANTPTPRSPEGEARMMGGQTYIAACCKLTANTFKDLLKPVEVATRKSLGI